MDHNSLLDVNELLIDIFHDRAIFHVIFCNIQISKVNEVHGIRSQVQSERPLSNSSLRYVSHSKLTLGVLNQDSLKLYVELLSL